MSDIILLDEYHLNPAVTNIPTTKARRIFCWDRTHYNHEHFSLNRLVFIYSYLCEHDVEIIDSSVADFLTAHPDVHYYVSAYLYQRDEKFFDHVSQTHYQVDSLIQPPEKSFRRFFPFWKAVKKQMMDAS